MLSILRKQSQQLEKELLEARQALDALKRQQAEHDAAILQKDEKIAELEEEIRHRRPLDELVLCRACGKPAEEEEEDWEKVEQEQAAAVSKAQKDELLQKRGAEKGADADAVGPDDGRIAKIDRRAAGADSRK